MILKAAAQARCSCTRTPPCLLRCQFYIVPRRLAPPVAAAGWDSYLVASLPLAQHWCERPFHPSEFCLGTAVEAFRKNKAAWDRALTPRGPPKVQWWDRTKSAMRVTFPFSGSLFLFWTSHVRGWVCVTRPRGAEAPLGALADQTHQK